MISSTPPMVSPRRVYRKFRSPPGVRPENNAVESSPRVALSARGSPSPPGAVSPASVDFFSARFRSVFSLTPALSVAVVLGLVRPGYVHVDVLSLLLGQLGQIRPERVQVQPGDLLVQHLRQPVHGQVVVLLRVEQLH